MKRSLCLVLAILFAVPALASAVTVYQNGMTFNVRVENRHFKEIRDARVSVWISGTQARLSAEAAGYRQNTAYVYLREGTTYYNTQVRLDDPSVSYEVEDATGQAIAGASIREDNFTAWGDEFKFELRIPAEGYGAFDRLDVDLRVNYGFPFGQRIYVRDGGTLRYVEITVKRRDLDRMFNRIEIRIPSDEQLADHRRNLKRAILDHVQKNPMDDEHRKALLKRVADR